MSNLMRVHRTNPTQMVSTIRENKGLYSEN